MKNTLKTLIIASAFVLPLTAHAEDNSMGMGKMDGKMMMQQCMKDKPCPMSDDMGKMQGQMGDMMQNMQSMMGMMKDPAMKEKMQKMHEQMGNMMQNMEQMHKNMGMMGGNDNMDSMKKDDSEHESHHPKK